MTGSDPDGTANAPPRRRLGRFWRLGQGLSWRAIAALVAAGGVAVALFVTVGGVNVSADTPDGWLSRHLLHFVFNRSTAARAAGIAVPDDLAAPSRVRLAAQHFDMVCANCHGRPGFGQSAIALSMSPRPQYLPKVVGQFSDAQLHQILEHGVKYSAMPSWPTATRGDEVWSMVAFLRQLPKLDAKSYADLTALPAQAGAAPVGGDPTASLRPADARRNMPPYDEFLYAAPASGFSDGGVHTNPVTTCARCHGPDGSGAVTGGEAPNLTLQDAAYLQTALDAYVRGSRRSGYMQNMASQLSAAQIQALAHYYAGLPAQATPSPAVDPAVLKRGETIALQGIPQTATPACANCHESAGSQVSGAPRLAGQSATFLRRQLDAMAQGGRGQSLWWNPMPAVAHGLDKTSIVAVAAYYASLKPTKTQGGGPSAQASQGPLPPDAKIDLNEARELFETRCVKCHVNHGRGDLKGDYPDLTLQTTLFVGQNLYAFRTGARPGDMMRQTTSGLTFDQMASLARYVNSLAPQPGLPKPDPAAAARGAAIAEHGAPARGVSACLSCHGAAGVGNLALIPRLQGQSAPYLRTRLDRFAKPEAQSLSALNPMPLIASRLTDQERADLAAYFAAAAPLPKPPPRP